MKHTPFGLIAVSFCTLVLSGCGALPVETPEQCPVHELPLERRLVPIRSSAPRHEYLEARAALFPYPGTEFSGQIAPSASESMTTTPVCPACSRAERDWVRSNRW